MLFRSIDRITREYEIDYVLDHASALHTNPEYAKTLRVPVILGPLNVAGKSFQSYDVTCASVKVLLEAGLLVSVMSDAPVIPLNLVRLQMFLIDRYRLNRADILDLFTENPAKTLGIEKQTGSLDVGKDADFIVLDGDIFDYRSHVRSTYIYGKACGGEDYEMDS